jgi:hypothetical protein
MPIFFGWLWWLDKVRWPNPNLLLLKTNCSLKTDALRGFHPQELALALVGMNKQIGKCCIVLRF